MNSKRPKCKTGYYKTLRGKHRENTLGHTLQGDLLDPPPRVTKIKTKINKWELNKPKSFSKAKEIINKMKRHLQNGRKIFANDATDDS